LKKLWDEVLVWESNIMEGIEVLLITRTKYKKVMEISSEDEVRQ